jgi:hypothetical protein
MPHAHHFRYLAESGHEVTVASRTVARAEKLIKGLPNCKAVALDAANPADGAKLEELMAATDIVLSLLPWTMHTPIAELALKHKKHFSSTSYISDAMDAMDAAFKVDPPPPRSLHLLSAATLSAPITRAAVSQVMSLCMCLQHSLISWRQ